MLEDEAYQCACPDRAATDESVAAAHLPPGRLARTRAGASLRASAGRGLWCSGRQVSECAEV